MTSAKVASCTVKQEDERDGRVVSPRMAGLRVSQGEDPAQNRPDADGEHHRVLGETSWVHSFDAGAQPLGEDLRGDE
jgi:hypothetical protein